MSVRFLVGAGELRNWRGALQALARVGTEVSLEAFPSLLVLRALNASRSAFLRVELQGGSFFIPGRWWDTAGTIRGRCQDYAGALQERWFRSDPG